ncbi:MAG: hypothetical protein JXJ19_00760 [Elusimicrobia bacterium]|nr:hypothetical protein [Elusimicrobiota bacterium]
MTGKYKKTLILIIISATLTLNCLFSAGWDLWVQTATHLWTVILLFVLLIGETGIPLVVFTPPFLIFVSGMLLSLLFSVTPVVSLIEFYNQVNYMAIFLLSAAYLSKDGFRSAVYKLMLFLGALVPLMDFLFPVVFKSPLFPNPNIKVGFLLLAVPLYLDAVLKTDLEKITLRQVVNLTVLLLIFASFYTSRSRIGFTVLFLEAGFYIALVRNNFRHMLRLSAVLAIAALLYLVYVQPPELADRISWLRSGFAMFFSRPLTGFGPGSTSHVLPVFIGTGHFSLYVHSFFVQFAADNGIIALGGLVWLISYVLWNIITGASYRKKIIFISLISLVVYNFAEYNLAIPFISLTMWCLAGTFSDFEVFPVRGRSKLAIILILTVMGFMSVKMFVQERYFTRGIYYLNKGRYALAESLFRKSLDMYPGYALGNIGLSLKYLYEDDLALSLETAGTVFPVKDGNPAYKMYLESVSLFDRDNREEAEKALFGALRMRIIQFGLDPRDYIRR